jgi:Nucleotidyltransferase of unknown function (DUF6036)
VSTADPRLEFFPILKVLREHRVEFVVIGGFAVILHGVVRATKDIDIVPEQSEANLERLWAALVDLQAKPAEIADFLPEEMPVSFTLDGLVEGGGNWVLETRLGRVDVMQWVTGVESYAALRAAAEADDVPEAGGIVWFAGFDDLIEMKREAGRDQDLLDITALRMAHGLEE